MKNIEQDKLRDIFGKMKIESPSMSLEKNIMLRVNAEHNLIEKKRNKLSLLSIVLGTLVLISIPIVVFTFFGYSIPKVSTSFDINIVNLLAATKMDHMMLSIAAIILLLLMGDTLIRKHLRKKEENE